MHKKRENIMKKMKTKKKTLTWKMPQAAPADDSEYTSNMYCTFSESTGMSPRATMDAQSANLFAGKLSSSAVPSLGHSW